MKQAVSPKIVYAVLGTVALTVLVFVREWAFTPAPNVPNPAFVNEPATGQPPKP